MPANGNGSDPSALIPALGSTFVAELTDAEHYPVLAIGKDRWSKYEIGRLGVVQTRACQILSTICKRLKITSTRDLFDNTSPYTFASEPAGVTTLYVMFSAFRDKGLNPQAWYHKGQASAIVSFHQLKHREQVAEQRTKADARSRARRARASEHRAAVDRIVNPSG